MMYGREDSRNTFVKNFLVQELNHVVQSTVIQQEIKKLNDGIFGTGTSKTQCIKTDEI